MGKKKFQEKEWGVIVKGKVISVEEWQRQPTDSENDRRRAEVMALAGAIWPVLAPVLLKPLQIGDSISKRNSAYAAHCAVELHAAIEAALAKKKTNEVIEEVLGHNHLKGK